MTEMTARVRERLQDRVIDWQERRFERQDFRQQHADIHRSRMTCSPSMDSFRQTQDWTWSMTQSGRVQVIEEAKPRKSLISEEGIRWDAALTALILAGILFAILLLADVATIGTGGQTIRKLNASITELESRNEHLQAEIKQNTDSASVRTEAIKLNLISSNGAETIRLTAPINAMLTLSTADKAAENAELEGRMTSYAGD